MEIGQIKKRLATQREEAIAHHQIEAISVDELIDMQADDYEFLGDVCQQPGSDFFCKIRWMKVDENWTSPEKRKQYGYDA